jgi:hypothetical protein
MKLNKQTLKRIIKEELSKVMNELNYGQEGGSNRRTGLEGETGYRGSDAAERKKKEDWENQRDRKQAAYDLYKRGTAEEEEAAAEKSKKQSAQARKNMDARNASYDKELQDKLLLNKMKKYVVPYVEKDKERLAKKQGFESGDALLKTINKTDSVDNLKAGYIQMLGQETYDSLMSGERGVFAKLGNMLKGGKFAEE